MEYADFVIVGGGLSGAAVAWQLTRRGAGKVLLLERETSLGTHATAQNAAMIRHLVEDPAMARLAREGATLLLAPPADLAAAFDQILGTPQSVRPCGSILAAATEPGCAPLRQMLADAKAAGLSAEWLSPAEIVQRVPGLEADAIAGGVWCAHDGVADPDAMMQAFARMALASGAEIHRGVSALGADLNGSRITAVRTSEGRIACGGVIDAGGAWARQLALELGGSDLPIHSYRRHIAVTAPLPAAANWPIIWDLERGFYARPESGRLLISACDQEHWPACRPPSDPEFLFDLGRKSAVLFPRVEFGIAQSWAGLRTFPNDGRFLLGPDPRLEGLYWAAGLGGHGVTTCGATARLLVDTILDGPGSELAPFLPARLLPLSTSITPHSTGAK
jgi:glycine/D-amino acid oxidase-like deaminating enzyme